MKGPFLVDHSDWEPSGAPSVAASLSEHPAVVLRGALPPSRCAELVTRVRAARTEWTSDFDGEQFSLGRAFYTHYETDRSDRYFAEANASDALVERVLPGIQTWTLELLGRMSGATIRRRAGFCGPGVHVFERGGEVARRGGVTHYDVEGLTPLCLARRHTALSLVVMLETPQWGGGLRLHDALYSGQEQPTQAELDSPHRTMRYADGDALLMSSYRLHQIRPFRGLRDRISITCHALAVDRGVLEAWF